MDSGVIIDDRQDTGDEFRRDLDSLYILPLRILPLRSTLFRRAKMIKDYRLVTAIEVFSDQETGSGRIYLDENEPNNFTVSEPGELEDLELLTRLGRLQSFDVYSLRMSLRELDVPVRSQDHLSLSHEKKSELGERMKAFTQPLLREVYGDAAAADASDIITLITDPDVDVALERLRALSDMLDIELNVIPKFLEDFSDIYLSLAYYQQCIEDVGYQILDFRDELRTITENWQMRQDQRLMSACAGVDKVLQRFDDGVRRKFDAFNATSATMWQNVSGERFRRIEAGIKAHHTTIGALLCGIGIKMQAWRALFPDAGAGGPIPRADALMSHIMPGMEKIVTPLKIMESLDLSFDTPAPMTAIVGRDPS